tara:strand:- start:494 stop:874 length:381 start_codon:yes stop_codon:yes gene_type:complete
MAKESWGRKISCDSDSCDAKFYDLNRPYPLTCPVCEHKVQQEIIPVSSASAKKVYEDNLESTVDDNLIGSDASESMLEDDTDAEIAMDDEEDTISLDDADVDVNDMDSELDGLDIASEDEVSLEEK